MEIRLGKLEDFARDVGDRLARIETKLEHVATSTAMAELRGEIKAGFAESATLNQKVNTAVHEVNNNTLKWMIGTVFTCLGILVAAVKYLH